MNHSRFLKSSIDDHGFKLDETTVNLLAGFPGSAVLASIFRSLASRA